MPNIETVRALVSAFNINNYDFNAVKTNFTLQSRGGEDCIVVSFDEGMNRYQCQEYLDSIKRKMVGEFYDAKEGRYEVVLNTGKSIFDVKSFPFNMKGKWSQNEQGRIEFLAPIDKGVIFNLKSHLAASLAKDVLEDMPTCNFSIEAPDKKGCLWLGKFSDKELCKEFEREFLFRMRERYENVPNDLLKVKDNSVYIRDVFDDARFIDSVTQRAAWRIGIDLGIGNDVDHSVMLLKDSIINSVYQSTKIIVGGFICASPLSREEASVLIPLILDSGRRRVLTKEEALELNYALNGAVLNDIDGKAQGELSVNGNREKYGIDFSNPYISHCVITKIIESSVINKDHELAIDPELVRALSPAQSPCNSPDPSGLRTPPNQRKEDRDSGIGESPPKPKDSVAHSPSGDPRSLFKQPQTQGFPSRSHGEELGRSPRQGSEKKQELHNPVNLAGPSKGFSPSPQLNSIAVSYGVSGPSSSQSVGAAKNVQAGTSAWTQPMSPWSSPAPSAGLWSLPQSRPSSWKGANESGSAWTSQPIGYWSSQSSNVKEDCKKICEDFEEAYEKIVSDSSLSKEEEKLFKKLLYWFNLNNYALDPPHTNFIVKNGKIASLIDDGVDVKEYLQEIIDKTKKEYRVNKKEACDLNEFPFQFLSNCEKNQETTVVANISRGALLNLKELFSREHEGKVEIKDIDIEKAVKSKKNKWVNSQVQEHGLSPKKAITTCYPDESVLEYISITKDKGGYWINRDYDGSEVESFRKEQWPAKGISKAEKMKSEDNKESGYSSGFVTDAENVSSKAEATTSGYESMDCENTRGGSPKRKSPSPEDGGNPRKSPKRDSLPLSRLESLSLSSSSHQIGKC